MTIGSVSGHREFVHAGTPGNAGKGEPGEPNGPHANHGDKGDNGRPRETGNGNGTGNGNEGVQQGNNPRTGGSNPASPEGNRGNQGSNGSQGNYGGPRDSGSMSTGGPGLPGLLDVAPDIVRQLGTSLFSMAGSAQSVLREAEGRPEHRHVPGPPSQSNANANAAPGNPSSSASAQANANPGPSAYARAGGVPMPSAMNAPNATGSLQGAFTAQGSATTPGAPTLGAATASAAMTAATPTTAATTSQPATLASQQRTAAEAALLAQNRPADAALAAGRTASTAPATAPPPTAAIPPTLPNAPAPPPGTTAALTAAGLTMATTPVNPLADARGVILPTNDAVAALRGENMLNPAGHTLDGAQRRSLRSRLGSMPKSGLARLLWAMGATGHTGTGEGSEREIARAMQWLFWMLAIIAYGCLAAAIVIFMGSDGRLMDSVGDRNSTAWLAMCGLATGVIAWSVARRMSRRR